MARPVVPVAATDTRPARVLNGLVFVSPAPATAELREAAAAVAVGAVKLDKELAGDVAATATM